MAANEMSVVVRMAQVFNPKEEGWSETVNMVMTTEFEGMVQNKETGLKEKTDVNRVSVFIGDVVRGLAAADASVAAFLAAKSHDEKVKLIPMLLSNSTVKMTREFDEDENEFITEIVEITIADQFLTMIREAIAKLFAF